MEVTILSNFVGCPSSLIPAILHSSRYLQNNSNIVALFFMTSDPVLTGHHGPLDPTRVTKKKILRHIPGDSLSYTLPLSPPIKAHAVFLELTQLVGGKPGEVCRESGGFTLACWRVRVQEAAGVWTRVFWGRAGVAAAR